MVKRLTLAMLLLGNVATAHAACTGLGEWIDAGCRTLVDTYRLGNNELLISGYAWHVPWTWTRERREQENANVWGAGLARTLEKPNGDTNTVYFLAFEDSHRNVEFNVGYAWLTYWRDRDGVQPGLGYTAMVLQRPDIAGGVTVPVVLPMFGLRYQRATLLATYIPKLNGGVNHGSVLYDFGSFALDGK